jgi:type III secretion protein J
MTRAFRIVVVAAAALLLAACAEVDLYSRLDEPQANELVALLMRAGIDAEKRRGEGASWLVRVPRESLPQAIGLARSHGLPREQFRSLGEVFRKEGLVSSPLEDRVRYLYALSQELSRTVSSIDGVVAARVHIAVPEKEPLSDKVRPSSASVFIKHREDAAVAGQVAAIKALVVNSVEGLPYDNVTVTLFAAEPAPVAANGAAPAARSRALVKALGIAAALAALAALGFVAWRMWLPARVRGAVRAPMRAVHR